MKRSTRTNCRFRTPWVLSIIPKIQECLPRSRMEMSVSVFSEWNIRDHLWRRSGIFRSEYYDRNLPFHFVERGHSPSSLHLCRELKSGKSHFSWLAWLDRTIFLPFPSRSGELRKSNKVHAKKLRLHNYFPQRLTTGYSEDEEYL